MAPHAAAARGLVHDYDTSSISSFTVSPYA